MISKIENCYKLESENDSELNKMPLRLLTIINIVIKIISQGAGISLKKYYSKTFWGFVTKYWFLVETFLI